MAKLATLLIALWAPALASGAGSLCAADEDASAQGAETADAGEHGDCCDDGAPDERDEGGCCPPDCHDCGCCARTVSSPSPAQAVQAPSAVALAPPVEPPAERISADVVSRVFRPPRA